MTALNLKWMTNDAWWKYDELGRAVIREDAPEEAQRSYREYLEQRKDKTVNRNI